LSLLTSRIDLNVLNRANFQESLNWEFYLFRVPTRTSTIVEAQYAGSIAMNFLQSNAMHYLVSDVSFNPLPTITNEFHKPTGKYFPRSVEQSNDLSVTFKETETFAVYNTLKSIMQTNVNTEYYRLKNAPSQTVIGIVVFYRKQGAAGRAAEVICGDITVGKAIEEIRALKTGQIFVFMDMKLTSTGGFSLSYGGGENLPVSASFNYNHVYSGTIIDLLAGGIFSTDFQEVRTSTATTALAAAFL